MDTATHIETLQETNSEWINALRRVDESEELFRRALALFEQVEGPDHPDVAATAAHFIPDRLPANLQNRR